MRDHDVTALTLGELDHTRRGLAASSALTRDGSPAPAPIVARLAASDAELPWRAAAQHSSCAR